MIMLVTIQQLFCSLNEGTHIAAPSPMLVLGALSGPTLPRLVSEVIVKHRMLPLSVIGEGAEEGPTTSQLGHVKRIIPN
jgi:hypothetical protein